MKNHLQFANNGPLLPLPLRQPFSKSLNISNSQNLEPENLKCFVKKLEGMFEKNAYIDHMLLSLQKLAVAVNV